MQAIATNQPGRSIVEIFIQEIADFSKYRLAKAYLRWTWTHTASDLTASEQSQWKALLTAINRALK